ncbi:hypothetical protein BC833DRAFT_602035 [Globomyces pollinis-pini]|nr:hypothetical protein BC833DRAFT_602035 [Globomyces pollinis-pini]
MRCLTFIHVLLAAGSVQAAFGSKCPAPGTSLAPKKECGRKGISKFECNFINCCWEPLEENSVVPWCFKIPDDTEVNDPIIRTTTEQAAPTTIKKTATATSIPTTTLASTSAPKKTTVVKTESVTQTATMTNSATNTAALAAENATSSSSSSIGSTIGYSVLAIFGVIALLAAGSFIYNRKKKDNDTKLVLETEGLNNLPGNGPKPAPIVKEASSLSLRDDWIKDNNEQIPPVPAVPAGGSAYAGSIHNGSIHNVSVHGDYVAPPLPVGAYPMQGSPNGYGFNNGQAYQPQPQYYQTDGGYTHQPYVENAYYPPQPYQQPYVPSNQQYPPAGPNYVNNPNVNGNIPPNGPPYGH